MSFSFLLNPAAQQPGVVRVCVYSDTNRFLGETDFEYEDMMDRVVFHAVQLGSEGVSKLVALMGKHMWNQSSSVKQISGKFHDTCCIMFTVDFRTTYT